MKPVPVCVFVKPPHAGEVKTRLAAALGSERARAYAEVFFKDTWGAVTKLDWARPVVASTGSINGLVPEGNEVWLQGEGDLGTRLERVLRRALRTSPVALAIGSDSPGLPANYLLQGRDELASHDVVLGPCSDGGFYLIGARKCPEGMLASSPWSQPDTLARTVDRLHACGLSTAMLGTWFDVDTAADLSRLEQLILAGMIRAPKTADLLKRDRCAPVVSPTRGPA